MSTEFVTALGLAASILIPLAFLPQTIKIIKTKNTTGISLWSYSIYFIGVIVLLVYAILINKTPVIVCQAINGTISATILSLTLYNFITKRKQGQK